jgi:hypothetical protein
MTNQLLPYATQTLSSKNKIVRQGTCPDHGKSSKYVGVQAHNQTLVWVFKCKEKNGHTFINYADRNAPKTDEGINEWIARQQELRVESLDRNKRTKK